MGQIPHPATGEPMANIPTAKYFIDTLGILQEKTKGNLSEEEEQEQIENAEQEEEKDEPMNEEPLQDETESDEEQEEVK